jgi:hypothetical protein
VDRFPEAFERFEQVVDIYSFRSYRELAYAFSHWAGGRWVGSYLQDLALRREAEKRGFRVARTPVYFEKQHRAFATRTWRHETVTVRGKSQDRYRDLSTGRFIKKP